MTPPSWFKRLQNAVFRSPMWKAVLGSVAIVLAGVLAGAFVNDITTPQGVVWGSFYKVKTFYLLVGFIILQAVYHRALFVFESAVERFSDADYCMAYMRSQCLPEAAEKYRELIRRGEFGTLSQAMQEVRDTLK